MKISIITINYNNKIGLQKTIESVVKQTYNDYEYIIIDGGSTDGSCDVIRNFSNCVTYWVSERDGGIYNAMNKGIKESSGDYCLFLNSGDVLRNGNVLTLFAESVPISDIVSCGIEIEQSTSYTMLPPKEISLFSLYHSSLAHQSTFIKRALFDRIGGYREEYRIMSDWCFFIEALIKHQCSYEYRDFIVSIFDTTGISSTNCLSEHQQSCDFLASQFPRIERDYDIEEYIYNTAKYFRNDKIILNLLFLSARIVNRIFKLRSKLRLRISKKI